MIHARRDYDRIQDPAVQDPSLLSPGSTPIGEDEPVFILRAKDELAPVIVARWLSEYLLHMGDDYDRDLVAGVDQHIHKMLQWQANNGHKLPDTPKGMMKLEKADG